MTSNFFIEHFDFPLFPRALILGTGLTVSLEVEPYVEFQDELLDKDRLDTGKLNEPCQQQCRPFISLMEASRVDSSDMITWKILATEGSHSLSGMKGASIFQDIAS